MGMGVIPLCISCGESGEAPVVIYPAMDFDAGSGGAPVGSNAGSGGAPVGSDAGSDAPPVVIYPAMDFDAGSDAAPETDLDAGSDGAPGDSGMSP
jgi:hypothetical protein